MSSRYGLQIRSVASADMPGLLDLMASVGWRLSTAVLASRLDGIRRESGSALVAIEWGPPSGLVVLTRSRTLAEDRPVGRIVTLLVRPEDRRRGLGRALLKAASQAARAAGCGALEIAGEGDAPGLRPFCDATGFDRAGEIHTRPLRRRGPGKPASGAHG